MNEKLVENWNNTVRPCDTVYHLGDVALIGVQKTAAITHRLNGNKILIFGNHDAQNKFSKNSKWEKLGFSYGYWHYLFEYSPEIRFQLSHFPYKSHQQDAREFSDQLEDKGEWLLCGHVHDNWKVKNKMINVGVDCWDYRPVSLDQILECQANISQIP